MKTILKGIIPAFLVLLAACNNDDTEDINISKRTDTQVRLTAQVENKSTKVYGPINSSFTTDFPIGIYAKNGAWLPGSSANWINNDVATVLGAAGHDIIFASGPYYYPSDGATLNFYAFAPSATESTPAAIATSPVVTHTITGHEDVMWATGNGYKVGSASASNPLLNFGHKLTQLQFTFKSGTGYPVSGNKVVSLFVKAQPTTVDMHVESGVCTFSGSADMQLLSSADQLAGISITSSGTDSNSSIMTNIAASYTVDVAVKPASGGPNVSYTGIPLTVSAAIGSAHMITLTFNSTSISATATVVDWLVGTSGTATAQ